MAQSLANVLVHMVFSTKERHPFLSDPTLRVALHKYLAAVSAQLRCPVITVGGVADHVHLLARQARTITLAGWVREVKRGSSLWVKEFPEGPSVFNGRPDTEPFPSVSRRAPQCSDTLLGKRRIIAASAFKRSSAHCLSATRSRTMNGTFGTDNRCGNGVARPGHPPRVAAARQAWATMLNAFGVNRAGEPLRHAG